MASTGQLSKCHPYFQAPPVLLDRDRLNPWPHPRGVEETVEMVDLVGDEPREDAVVVSGGAGAVEGGGLHGDGQRPGDHAADVDQLSRDQPPALRMR